MDYKNFIEKNILEIDAGYRGGKIRVNASDLFPYIDGAIVGAFQNYLGGGLLGAIVGASDFLPSQVKKQDVKKFYELVEACKKYLHDITNHVDDEWESASFEENQNRPVSAY